MQLIQTKIIINSSNIIKKFKIKKNFLKKRKKTILVNYLKNNLKINYVIKLNLDK